MMSGDGDVHIVTILILIDGFLQFNERLDKIDIKIGHNPYFNRWFSAISTRKYGSYGKAESQSLF